MEFDFNDAMKIIHDAEKLGSIMGTETMKQLLFLLDNPQDKLKTIHIAGTNGKGSTLAMISTILTNAGYRVGRYISPTLITYLERIQINGEYITETEFTNVIYKIKLAMDKMVDMNCFLPTAFEIETAASFLYFYEMKCDFVVIETGLGGTFDATNVIKKPLCCVLTSIGMDHMGILGNSLSEIAANKAGIIMNDSNVISTLQDDSAMNVIKEKCINTSSSFFLSDYQSLVSDIKYESSIEKENININNKSKNHINNIYKDVDKDYDMLTYNHKIHGKIKLRLLGRYQIINSCLAISCIDVLNKLGYNISEQAIKTGLSETEWFGRFTKISTTPLFFVDGAHNRPAALVLAETIDACLDKVSLGTSKLVYIMGVFKDKDYQSIIDILIPKADKVFTIATPDNPRAMDSLELAKIINASGCNHLHDNDIAYACSSIKEAVKLATEYNNGDVAVVAFGSLSHLYKIKEALSEWRKNDNR